MAGKAKPKFQHHLTDQQIETLIREGEEISSDSEDQKDDEIDQSFYIDSPFRLKIQDVFTPIKEAGEGFSRG